MFLIFPSSENETKPAGDKRDMKTMKAILQLQWLIIDEISMVSARFLLTLTRSYATTRELLIIC